MPKRHIKTRFYAICLECSNETELNLETMKQRDIDDSIEPFSAKSSNSTIACNECYSIKHRVIFAYHYYYRNRCKTCNEMFDAEYSNIQNCKDCWENSFINL